MDELEKIKSEEQTGSEMEQAIEEHARSIEEIPVYVRQQALSQGVGMDEYHSILKKSKKQNNIQQFRSNDSELEETSVDDLTHIIKRDMRFDIEELGVEMSEDNQTLEGEM